MWPRYTQFLIKHEKIILFVSNFYVCHYLCDTPNSHYQPRENESQWREEGETIRVMRRRTFFVQLLVECVHNGSIVRGSVNKELWPELTRVMNERTNRVWTAGQISSKYERLWTDHREFSELLNDETGLGGIQ